jgi:hypothetical protein
MREMGLKPPERGEPGGKQIGIDDPVAAKR